MDRPARIAALLLAAGRATRMRQGHKLLAELWGRPLILWSAEALTRSRANPVIVVTGAKGDAVAESLKTLPLTRVHNADHARGMGASIARGMAALKGQAPNADGVLICLGDMPTITAADIDRLIEAFDGRDDDAIVVPVHGGRRGHPVLFGRAHFAALGALVGDTGARTVIEAARDHVSELDWLSDAVLRDVDTDEDLARLGRTPALLGAGKDER